MGLLSDGDRRRVQQSLAEMVDPVRLLFFTQAINCDSCLPTRQILDELASLNEKLTVVEHNALIDREAAAASGVTSVPAIVVSSESASRITFYGAPSGYEFMSLIDAILVTSKGESGLKEESRALLKAVDKAVRIQVFVTPT
jgi:alkyl hydroperoxide reductase subunit AhpF